MAPSSAESRPLARPPAYLFALGNADLPQGITNATGTYRHIKTFKHDFFAATALYQHETSGELAVLKLQRTYHLWGFPMRWLGRLVAGHEIKIYQKLQGLPGIPKYLGRFGKTGFLHEFIPGVELSPELPLDGRFFEELRQLFAGIHARHVAYVDSNKRENILFGADARPYLIDFQISFIASGKGYSPATWILRKLQKEDWYHYFKHKSRLARCHCSAEDLENAQRRSWLIRIHRLFAQPIIKTRRRFLSRYDLKR